MNIFPAANHNNLDRNNQQQNGQLDRLGRAREFAEKYIQVLFRFPQFLHFNFKFNKIRFH